MTLTILSVENVSKQYRLGVLGSGTASEDLQRWFTKTILRRDPDANLPSLPGHRASQIGDMLWALRDVSMKVDEGEIIGIIGRNGAGKSTLLKILSQITVPTSGLIRIGGRLASLLEVGVGFNGELTGRENIFLNGSILGMTPNQIRHRFDEIVAFAEVEDFIDTPVKRYSSGMFVRLAFSVAAHLEADIIVIDEVLAVGDIGFQKKCLGKMSQVSRSGRTVLFVSHRMDHISALCPRSIVLEKGRMIFDGKTDAALGVYYRLFETEERGLIASRTDREGRGRVRIIDLWIENDLGDRVDTLITGKPAVFKLLIKSKEKSVIRSLNAGIAIFTMGSMFVASLSTQEGGLYSFDMENPEMLVTFRIDRLTLNNGQFYLNAVLRSAIGAYEFDDLVENAKEFLVDYGDFHGIGQASGGFMSLEHRAFIGQSSSMEYGASLQ